MIDPSATDERSPLERTPDPSRRRLAIGSVSFVALLAFAAAVLQLLDGGAGAWRGLSAATMGAWWFAVAVFLSRK
jgi:hypothetical protein